MEPYLTILPRAISGGKLQVWLGAFHYIRSPELTWHLDGRAASPVAVQTLDSVRSPDWDWVDVDEPRAFTGIYQFETGIQPGTRYRVEVQPEQGRGDRIETRTLPAEIPGGTTWFTILLASCFHWSQDRAGTVGALVRTLPVTYRPHLSLLLGDQVYLDLPAFSWFRSDEAWLAQRFERDYTRNWTEATAYASVLGAAPSVSIPDDHEYWNNFPHWATIIRNTWAPEGRAAWKAAAQRMYKAFQLPQIPSPPEVNAVTGRDLGDPVILTIPPLSLFVLDSRSCREEDRTRSIKPEALSALRQWVDFVLEQDFYGVIATGQSYLEEAADWRGKFSDYKLGNYEDMGLQIKEILRLAYSGLRQVITITGDVHWGRLAAARPKETEPARLYEVVSSPTALVEDPRNKLKRPIRAFKGLFQEERDEWPEHSEPPTAAAELGLPADRAHSLTSETLHPQKGNHIALLSFRRRGPGLEMRVAYWPIQPSYIGREPKSVLYEPLQPLPAL